MAMRGILPDESLNQEFTLPVSGDDPARRYYQSVTLLNPNDNLRQSQGDAQTLWLVAGALALLYFFKKKG